MDNIHVAVVLASGKGRRMGTVKNKVFLTVGRKPLLFYALNAFEKNAFIKKIVIVARDEERSAIRKIIRVSGFKKVVDIITGGDERQISALNSLQYLAKKLDKKTNPIVLFHNGANPFVSQEEINQCIIIAKEYGACAVARPTKDTIKEVTRSGTVTRTLDRKKLWNIQTPQAIRFRLAYKAFQYAQEKKFIGTDDVSLVERLGKKVKILPGSPYNFKITDPIDLELARLIFRKFKKSLS